MSGETLFSGNDRDPEPITGAQRVLAKLAKDGHRIRTPIMAVLLGMFTVVTTVFLLTLFHLKNASIDEALRHASSDIGGTIASHIDNKIDAMDHTLLALAHNRSLSEAFQQRDRESLLNASYPLFDELRDRYLITHFYFVQPNRETFLRVHQPDRRGDIIGRGSMLQAEATGNVASGIEMGPLGTFTLRMVRPWYHQGELIGYLELGQEIDQMFDEIRVDANAQFIWMVHKDRVPREKWEANRLHLGVQSDWDTYTDYVEMASTLHVNADPEAVGQAMLNTQHQNEPTNMYVDGKPSIVTTIPLDHWHGVDIGVLGTLIDTSFIEETFWTSTTNTSFIILAVVLFSSLIFYQFISIIESKVVDAQRRLAETNMGLQKEIEVRQRTEARLIEARERAEEASQAKSEFLTNMSHELRTPLNGVLGMSELLLMSDLDENTRESIAVISESGDTLLSLLNDVLDLSRIESGKFELEPAALDIKELVDSTLRSVEASIVSKGLWIDKNIPDDLPSRWVSADALRIRQILCNLICNAVKFTHDGGVAVAISQKPLQEGRVETRFEVRDTGIGIPEAKQKQIFEAFTQADQSTTRKYGGTGLGLSIAKELAEMMGGKIGVKSEVGEGSLFWFTIVGDVAEAPWVNDENTETPVHHGATEVTGDAPYVLVAEDNQINQFVIGKLLDAMAVPYVMVDDGKAAVAAASSGSYDLILMDINMPKMDGVEATQIIKGFEGDAGKVPVIAITANAMQGDRERYLAAGIDGYLPKPIGPVALQRVIDQFTAGSGVETPDDATAGMRA